MKKNWIYLMAFATLLQNCTTVYFKEAQPKGVAHLNAFPADYQGSYLMDQDTIVIEELAYTFPVVYEKSLSLAEIDTNVRYKIENDLFYDIEIPIKKGIKFTIKNDTLHYRKKVRGIKVISDSLVIKYFDKYLIVNELDKKTNYWVDFVLEKKKNSIIVHMVGHLKTEDDTGDDSNYDQNLDDFKSITPIEKLEVHKYLLDPSPAEFKKLIKKGFFSATLVMNEVTPN